MCRGHKERLDGEEAVDREFEPWKGRHGGVSQIGWGADVEAQCVYVRITPYTFLGTFCLLMYGY